MKKIILSILFFMIFAGASLHAETIKSEDIGTILGLNTLSVSAPKSDAEGNFVGYSGFSVGTLGYLSKTYYNPVQVKSWNTFWNWGTALVVVPFFGWGTDYYFSKKVSLGLGLNLIFPIFPGPYINLSFNL